MKKRFYVIDGHSQIFRAYYAPFNLLTAPSGEPVKATYIFTQMVLAILRDKRPDYIAVAFDVSDSTTRRASLDPSYKANRDETPEDLPPQIARIQEILTILGIPIFQMAGYEADDLIASIAQKLADRDDLELIVVSRDKDLNQLLSDRVKLWDPVKDELLDPEALEKRLGFRPEQAVDIQTLTGDSVDNIRGVQGVGPKTAVSLLQKYGSIPGILEHLEELPPKLRVNLKAFSEGPLEVTRQLVTLDREAPVPLDLEACKTREVPVARLRPLFQALTFRRLLEQLDAQEGSRIGARGEERAEAVQGGEGKESSGATEMEALGSGGKPAAAGGLSTTTPGHYTLVDDLERFEAMMTELRGQKRLAVDTETTSLRPVDADLVGISLSWTEGTGYYLPFRSNKGRTLPSSALEELKPILEDSAVGKLGQNLKFDLQVLRNEGIRLRGIELDSMLASYLLRPEARGHGMDALARELLGHQTIPISDLIGKGKQTISMLDVDTRTLADYAGEDADITWRLCERFAPLVAGSTMSRLYREVELPLLEVLADMEYAGIKLDCALLERIQAGLETRLDHLRGEVFKAAGREFTLDSPKQLAAVLFDDLKLRVVRKTKTSRSTDAEVLQTLAVETAHPLPALVLEYRELAKLIGTYLAPLPSLVSPRTGRLHASFHQAVTSTGRLSSSDPNIQNIPVRSETGREIRKAFVPADANHVLVTADYSQIELRVLAHLSRDAALLDAFRSDLDIHAFVAAQIAGLPVEAVNREQRSRAKAVNFGIIYGQGAFGLARVLGVPQREAATFIEAYKRRYPGIERFLAACIHEAEETGRVTTLLGRQRAIPEIRSKNRMLRAQGERFAINTVVQGTAADLIKVAMVRIHRRLRDAGSPARILIQVHDELVLECPASLAPEIAAMLKEEMEGAMSLDVPLKVDVAWGHNWLETKDA